MMFQNMKRRQKDPCHGLSQAAKLASRRERAVVLHGADFIPSRTTFQSVQAIAALRVVSRFNTFDIALTRLETVSVIYDSSE